MEDPIINNLKYYDNLKYVNQPTHYIKPVLKEQQTHSTK